MSEKRKNLQSPVLKCATIVAVAVSAGGKHTAAEGPVGTAYNDQNELFEQGRPGDETDGQRTSAHVPT